MALPARTRTFLQSQGITEPDDLKEFVKKSAWDQLIKNCKRPPQIPDLANAGQFINDVPMQFPAKSLLRLRVAAKAILYYDRTGRGLTVQSLLWVRLSNFEMEYDSIQEAKKANDNLTLPVISGKLLIGKWFEAYETYVDEFIGQADCPLKWIYREDSAVAAVAPALAHDQPFSNEHGSVAEELVARMRHDHALYRPDNTTGYALSLIHISEPTRPY